MRITTPKAQSPPPVMVPSSNFVNPYWAAQSGRIAPRMANPTPAAISVRKLATKIAVRCFGADATVTSLIDEGLPGELWCESGSEERGSADGGEGRPSNRRKAGDAQAGTDSS